MTFVFSSGNSRCRRYSYTWTACAHYCLYVYICERHTCASCPWMDVPLRASSAMFKEAVLISALVRRSRLEYPQGLHVAMIAGYAWAMWRRDTSFGTAQAMARGRAEALLNRDASNAKISLCAVMTLTSHNQQSDRRDHACASPHIRYVSLGQPSAWIRPGWSDIALRVPFGSRATSWHNG